MLKLTDLRVNHRKNPIGIDTPAPLFAWKLESDLPGAYQTGWRIVCKAEDGALLWDSGMREGGQSLAIPYEGAPLASRQRAEWTLTAITNQGSATAAGTFEMGLLSRADWLAQWVEPEDEDIDIMNPSPAPYLRKTFFVKPGLVRARAYQTAHGLYHFWLNGKEGADRCFTPGDTSYFTRLQYQADDVTALLTPGENTWAARLGDGWWRGGCGGAGIRCNYGRRVHFLGQIVLEYADGTTDCVISDAHMQTATGGLLQCDPKIGSVYDARLEPAGWKENGFDASAWKRAHVPEESGAWFDALIAEVSVPVREVETFAGKPFYDVEGSLCVDFGQNIAGYCHMKLRGLKPGQRVMIEHAEDLNQGKFDDSNVFIKETSNYEHFQTVIYYASGADEEAFYPEFSVFGFRYARVTGYAGPILPGDFTAAAVYSDMPVTYRFQCSNPLLNKLYSNSLWSQKGNFLDVPTDCPTRERAPWSGDAQVYSRTASEMMDVYTFMLKWMGDLRAEQAENGAVATHIPGTMFHNEACFDAFVQRMMEDPEKSQRAQFMLKRRGKRETDCSVGWGDVATVLPYMTYVTYGDRQILEEQYESAKKYVEYMRACAKAQNPTYKDEKWNHAFDENGEPDADCIWDSGFHFGEWSEPGFIHRTLPANMHEERMRTGDPAVATAYLSYSSGLLAKMARILGKPEDEKAYAALSRRVAALYAKYLIADDGSVRFTDACRQAPYVRVLAFGLCTEKQKPLVLGQLLRRVKDQGYHLNTGFLSTPMLLPVLSDMGHTDAAYRVLEQPTGPSWLYPVIRGATTIYESWDGPDLFFGSFNHYSYGAVCDFMMRYINGIRFDEDQPGYRHFFLKPVPGGTLTRAEGSFISPYGEIRTEWTREGGRFRFACDVPANTSCVLTLPDGSQRHLDSGRHAFDIAWEE